jgi:hypothetical protein
LLFDPDEAGSFERNLDRLCGSPDLRSELGTRARALVDERGLTWETNARRVTELFGRLGAGGKGNQMSSTADGADR